MIEVLGCCFAAYAENVVVKAPATAAAGQPDWGSSDLKLAWTFNGTSYRLYKTALNWRMAENSCRDLGPGFHLASHHQLSGIQGSVRPPGECR